MRGWALDCILHEASKISKIIHELLWGPILSSWHYRLKWYSDIILVIYKYTSDRVHIPLYWPYSSISASYISRAQWVSCISLDIFWYDWQFLLISCSMITLNALNNHSAWYLAFSLRKAFSIGCNLILCIKYFGGIILFIFGVYFFIETRINNSFYSQYGISHFQSSCLTVLRVFDMLPLRESCPLVQWRQLS